jgi:hypothetical protein
VPNRRQREEIEEEEDLDEYNDIWRTKIFLRWWDKKISTI